MTPDRTLATLFALDERGWARHANPWSGWTRFATGLPLLALAIWSRVWLGWWATVPIALAVLWLWLNPRAFPPPASDAAWMSRGVFGERFWTRRDRIEIPAHHRTTPRLLIGAGLLGVPLLAWGLATLAVWPTVTGAAVIIVSKLWFVDRMAWLYQDVTAERPELRYRPAATRQAGKT